MPQPLILTGIFILEIICLYFFSKLLIQSIAQIVYSLTRSHKAIVYVLATLFLPGTVIHELAHALTAGVMLVHVGNIEFVPQITDRGVKLGSAEIGVTDPLRRSLIGLAPAIVGLTIIISSLYFITSNVSLSALPIWAWIASLYILFVTSNTMFSSRKDMEGVIETLVVILCIFLAFYLLKFYAPFTLIEKFLTWRVEFIKKMILLLLIPLGLDLLIYSFFKLLLFRK